MPIRNIIQVGEPSLTERSSEVIDIMSDEIQSIVKDLRDSHHNAKGVGLAAPQIAQNYRIFVSELPLDLTRNKDIVDSLRVYINPEIIEYSKDTVELYEACLSIVSGDLYLPVIRSKEITVEAYDEKGDKFRLNCNGFLARVIQHEFDHLEGTLFIERVRDFKQVYNLENYRRYKKDMPELINARKITKKEFSNIIIDKFK